MFEFKMPFCLSRFLGVLLLSMPSESQFVCDQAFSQPTDMRGWGSLHCFTTILTVAKTSHGEEPYQRFLEKLKSERLFDLALIYLDDLQDEPGVTEDFKAVIALERGMLLYSAASQMTAQNAQRPVKLDQAEQAIRNFLKTRQEHPRRGEAQLTLGNLLLTRAEEAKAKAGEDVKQDIPDAIKFFSEAHDLFQETVKELAAILEQIKGARTDASDTNKVAYRDQIRGEIRRSQLLAAAAMENRGRSRVAQSPDWKKDSKRLRRCTAICTRKKKRSSEFETMPFTTSAVFMRH